MRIGNILNFRLATARWGVVPLKGAGAKHFVMAAGFEPRGGHAGDSNRITQSVEDFDRKSLAAVRNHVVVHQLDDVPAVKTMLRHIGIGSRMAEACSCVGLFTSGMDLLQMK